MDKGTILKYKDLINDFDFGLLSLLNTIDKNRIDFGKSDFIEKDNYLIINLFSKENKHCPLNWVIDFKESSDIKFCFYLDFNGQIIHQLDTSIPDNSKFASAVINEVLLSPVIEERTYSKNDIAKTVFKYKIRVNDKTEIKKYTAIKKILFPWSNKRKKIVNFDSWIG